MGVGTYTVIATALDLASAVMAMTRQLGDVVVMMLPCSTDRVGGKFQEGMPGVEEEVHQTIVGIRRPDEVASDGAYNHGPACLISGLRGDVDFE